MFKPGDIIEIKEGAPYAVTKAGTKWLVYSIKDEGVVRVGTLPVKDKTAEWMIARYGYDASRMHVQNRFDDNIKIFSVHEMFCRIAGNNALFKDKLSQDDPWEEEKKTKVSLKNTTWEDWTPW